MKKVRIITLVILSITCSLITWGLTARHSRPVTKVPAKKLSANPKVSYDPALLAEYEKLYKNFETLPPDYTMAGSINVVDPADTSDNMKNVPFFLCKQGDQFYYKLGFTETLNANGRYVFIDNSAGDIIVSDQKKVQYDQSPISFAEMGRKLLAEDYRMSSSEKGSLKTISFSSAHHVSCKLFAVTYDPGTYTIKDISARLTDIQQPLNNDRDKLVDIRISEWTLKANLGNYDNLGRYFAQTGGEPKGTGKYKDYHIIMQ